MPADELLPRFQEHLQLERHWRVDGTHYARTSEAWLRNLDMNRAAARKILASANGLSEAAVLLQRWRMFFLAVAELFNYQNGQQWWVSHYRFSKR